MSRRAGFLADFAGMVNPSQEDRQSRPALVPTLRVGTPSWTLRRPFSGRRGRGKDDAERRGRHSHAERGNEADLLNLLPRQTFHSFPRSAWERRPGRSRVLFREARRGAGGKTTRSVADCIPTQSVGTSRTRRLVAGAARAHRPRTTGRTSFHRVKFKASDQYAFSRILPQNLTPRLTKWVRFGDQGSSTPAA